MTSTTIRLTYEIELTDDYDWDWESMIYESTDLGLSTPGTLVHTEVA
jgi:hypothetical protein